MNTDDLESIQKRHGAAISLARDLQRMTLHGPAPGEGVNRITTAIIAATLIGPRDDAAVRNPVVIREPDGRFRLPRSDEWAAGLAAGIDLPIVDPMVGIPDIDVTALVAEYGTGKPNRAQRRGNVHGHLGRKPGPARRR